MNQAVRGSMVALIAAGVVLTGVAQAGAGAAGELDTTFNPCDSSDDELCGGLLVATVGDDVTDSPARAVAVQPDDGKIVVAGRVGDGLAHDWLIRRYRPDGDLDASFGDGGTVITETIAGTRHAGIAAVTVHADGTIVVAGTAATDAGEPAFGVARYQPDGELDASFGDGGTVVTDVTSADIDAGQARVTGLAVADDGGIVVAGDTRHTGASLADPNRARIRVARYTTTGELDAAFGVGGIATADFAALGYPDTRAHDLAVDARGRAVVVGHARGAYEHHPASTSRLVDEPPSAFALARFTTAGQLDATFGTRGRTVTPFDTQPATDVFSRWDDAAARSVAIDDHGRIVAAGTAGGQVGVARYTPTGVLDTDFGPHELADPTTPPAGTVTTPGAHAFDVALQGDGRLLVAGHTTADAAEIAALRYTVDGELDDTFFAGTGQVHTPVAVDGDRQGGANAMTLDGLGRLVVAGHVGDATERLLLGRYLTADNQAPATTGAIAGTVTDSHSGEAIGGADVTVTDTSDKQAGTATIAADGTYEVADLQPATYTVTVDADVYQPASRDTTVDAGQTAIEDVALEPEPGGIAGTVTNAHTGKPVDGATVTVTDDTDTQAGRATTDADGGYDIGDLDPGDYTVTVDAAGYQSASRVTTVDAGQTTTEDVPLDRRRGR